MAREMPVGTIRSWTDGEYIKASSIVGNKFDGNWIPLKKVPSNIQELSRKLDQLANSIVHIKQPTNGMLYLDHEIKNFEIDPPFNPDEFKKWGNNRYAFREVMFSRYLQSSITLHDKIQIALEEANEEKGIQLGKTQEQLKQVFLTKDEVAEIRAEVRASDKEDVDPSITEPHLKALLEVIERTTTNIKKGVSFEGKEKEGYDKAVEISNSLSKDYERLPLKKQQMEDAIKLINETFPDNWGIRQTFQLKIEDSYREYLNKYKKRIIEDEGKEQEERFGIKLDDNHEVFYKAVLSKVEEDVVRISNVDLNLHLGKSFSVNSWVFGKLQESSTSATGYEILRANGRFYDIDREEELFEIQKQISPPKYPFSELLEIRFGAKYGISLSGKWDFLLLPALQEMEKMMNSLPPGHVLDNENIRSFWSENSNGGSHGGYAWYDPTGRSINFSTECSKYAKMYATTGDLHEFKSTLAHEIGHAVSQKFKRHRNLDYKKFAVECGWSYQQQEVRGGKIATGNDPDIPRLGSNSGTPLITKYAHKSPEEAFAEYYSLYTLHKERIDSWLEGEQLAEKSLTEVTARKITSGTSSKQLSDHILRHTLSSLPSSEIVDEVSQQIEKNQFDLTEVEIQLHDPWEVSLHKKISTQEYDMNLVRNYVQGRKNNPLYPGDSPLIVAVDHGKGKIQAISDLSHTALHIAKAHRTPIPTVVIPKEFYFTHLEKGVSSKDIAGAYLNLLQQTRGSLAVPAVKDTVQSDIKGLTYRNTIIPLQTLKKNFSTLKAMKKIWESDELKKALEEMGLMTPVQKKKKVSTAAIIRDVDGNILFLKRSNLDSFHPGTWCLPGGGVDEGETPDEGVIREVLEETGLKAITCQHLKTYELEEIDLHYFECMVLHTEPFLDNNEHGNYEFCSISEWMGLDLILDLKQHLVEMLPTVLGSPITPPTDDDLEKGITKDGLVAKKVADKNGKMVTRWVREIPENSSSLKEYLKGVVSMFGNDSTSKQKDFYVQQLERATSIKIHSIRELQKEFPQLISYFKKNRPETKQCYKNSSQFILSVILKDTDKEVPVKYVEGLYSLGGIPIEHAWVKVGDKYYDPTLELDLKRDTTKDEYLSLLELEAEDMMDYMNSTQTYGPYMLEFFKDQKKLK